MMIVSVESRRPVGFDYTLYIRLTLAEPEVRIHLPPAESPQTFGPARITANYAAGSVGVAWVEEA